ncbi:MAG TPA: XdhC/CoxI family protein [Gemmatimonadales bacterium]|nr:XdhC/CoxI family protein [Gemmatimonadales bacterium]
MRNLLGDYDRFRALEPVGRAVVTSVWGSAPQAEGASLLVTASGRMAGSVSGGCVEAAVAESVRAAIARGEAGLVRYGVSDERAWEVGLACGGTLEVLVEPAVAADVLAAARGPGGVVVGTVLEGPGIGTTVTFTEAATPDHAATADAVAEALRSGRSRSTRLPVDGVEQAVFLEAFPRPKRLVVFGGVHIAAELVPMARALGYHTIVADGRPAFLSRDRFPTADELILAWPEEAFARAGIDSGTAVVVLTHDPKFDDPALLIALRSPAMYVGAIGSKKTQASRRARLLADGVSEEQLARLHGPIGLDLGGRTPAETALAIVAEMTAVRFGGAAAREAR